MIITLIIIIRNIPHDDHDQNMINCDVIMVLIIDHVAMPCSQIRS